MRQDHLSTSYWCQHMQLARVKCAEMIKFHFSHTFDNFTDEISLKFQKTCQTVHGSPDPLICMYAMCQVLFARMFICSQQAVLSHIFIFSS